MLWEDNRHLLRQQWLKYHEFRQIYTNGYLKLSHIAFDRSRATIKWLYSKYKPIYDSSMSTILTASSKNVQGIQLQSSLCRIHFPSHLELVAKVVSNLSTLEQS